VEKRKKKLRRQRLWGKQNTKTVLFRELGTRCELQIQLSDELALLGLQFLDTRCQSGDLRLVPGSELLSPHKLLLEHLGLAFRGLAGLLMLWWPEK